MYCLFRVVQERRPLLWASSARAAGCQTVGLGPTSTAPHASHRSAAIIEELALSDYGSDAATPAPRSAAMSPSASGSALGAPPVPPPSEDPPAPRLLELAISGPLCDTTGEGICGPGWQGRGEWGAEGGGRGGRMRREEAQSEAVSSFVQARSGTATSVRVRRGPFCLSSVCCCLLGFLVLRSPEWE